MSDNTKQIIKDTAKETAKAVRHEFDLVIEDLEKGTLTAINEQLDTHTKQLGRLEERIGNVESMKDDVEAIKLAVLGTETEKPLKQRVEDLELKVNPA